VYLDQSVLGATYCQVSSLCFFIKFGFDKKPIGGLLIAFLLQAVRPVMPATREVTVKSATNNF
jgi:hypothetical protein